jgi:hypothetical protein
MSAPERTETVASDTSAAADDVQVNVYRRMGGAARVAVVFRLNHIVRSTAKAGIRNRHPEYDDRRVEWAWQRLMLGDELFQAAFPGRELVDP